MKKDKYLYKNWEENDVFAWKIKCENPNYAQYDYSQYEGKYLLFIYSLIKDKYSLNKKLFYVKITNDDKLPTTYEEINNLEYVDVAGCTWVERFYAMNKNELIDEYKNPTIFPEKNGMIYNHLIFLFGLTQNKIKDNWTYVGNFKLDKPKGEYLSKDDKGNLVPLTQTWSHLYKNMPEALLYWIEINKKEKLSQREMINLQLEQFSIIKGSLHLFPDVNEINLPLEEWEKIILTVPKSNNPDHYQINLYEEYKKQKEQSPQ